MYPFGPEVVEATTQACSASGTFLVAQAGRNTAIHFMYQVYLYLCFSMFWYVIHPPCSSIMGIFSLIHKIVQAGHLTTFEYVDTVLRICSWPPSPLPLSPLLPVNATGALAGTETGTFGGVDQRAQARDQAFERVGWAQQAVRPVHEPGALQRDSSGACVGAVRRDERYARV